MMKSPYFFVPLLADDDPIVTHGLPGVVCPEWGSQVSHDIPFSDALSGWLELKITNHTPLFIKDSEDPNRHYTVRTAKGDCFAIPGTSLRGMFRQLISIISFSRMQHVDTHRYGVRDLQNRDLYGTHMTRTVQGAYEPKVQSGWLVSHGGDWEIHPCDHWRVECRDLEELGGFRFSNREPDVSKRYNNLGSLERERIWFQGEAMPGNHRHSGNKQLRYKKARCLALNESPDAQQGWVVLTGRPGSKKHMDFIFGEKASQGTPLLVSKDQRRDFEFIHSDGNEQHQKTPKPNDALRYWQRRIARQGEHVTPGIPVFYLEDNKGQLRSFGMAQMFKLAYANTPKELYLNYLNKVDKYPKELDFASLLFGQSITEGEKSIDTLRGRASFETALSENASRGDAVTTILGSPKPTYYPSYIRQKVNVHGEVSRYSTYMDDHASLAGWKRYQQRAKPPRPSRPAEDQMNVATTLHPLRNGATFTTRLHIHNLRPIELGALLWAIDFGGRKECRHFLGMGRPYGYGSVSISISQHEVEALVEETLLDEERLQECCETFVKYMNEQLLGEWETSEQLLDLIALATPGGGADEDELRYMKISDRNEFVQAKKDKEALVGPRFHQENQQSETDRKRRIQPETIEAAKQKLDQRLEEYRAEELLQLKKQAEEEAKAEEARKKAEEERLLALSPEERQAERIRGLLESELCNLAKDVFQAGDNKALTMGLSVDERREKEALQKRLLDHEQVQSWRRGKTEELSMGKAKLKELYKDILGDLEELAIGQGDPGDSSSSNQKPKPRQDVDYTSNIDSLLEQLLPLLEEEKWEKSQIEEQIQDWAAQVIPEDLDKRQLNPILDQIRDSKKEQLGGKKANNLRKLAKGAIKNASKKK